MAIQKLGTRFTVQTLNDSKVSHLKVMMLRTFILLMNGDFSSKSYDPCLPNHMIRSVS